MRILIILNADRASCVAAGREYEGLIEAYYLFNDAGAEVVMAAPGGGSGYEVGFAADADASSSFGRFRVDRRARDLMNDLVDTADVCAEDFDAVLCLQPHKIDPRTKIEGQALALLERLLVAGKPVAVIGAGHAFESNALKKGLLMLDCSREAPRQAAKALLGAIDSDE